MRTLLIGLLGLCTACNASQQPGEQNLVDTQDQATTASPFPIDTEAPFWLHLEGKIGDYPISMEIKHLPNRYATGSGYEGYYYYQKYGQPIGLYGAEDEPGVISLTESDVEGSATGNFRGSLSGEGLFKGRWISGDQKRTLPFELKPSDGQRLFFDVLEFSDSLLIATGAEEAPRVHVSQTWLYPRAGEEADLVHFLRAEIRRNMVGDSLAQSVAEPLSAFNASKQGYFQEYRNEIESLLEYQRANPDEESWMMDYDFSKDMEIYYLSPTLLTVGFSEYSFTGGAHGNYGTGVYSYDLVNKKELRLADVFKPGYEAAVSKLLAAKARQTYRLNANQPLSEIFFQDDIGPTENFGLTDKGIFFVYNPYEIAAYVYGQIELFVSFAEVEEWVKR